MGGDQLKAVIHRIHVQQMIFLGINLTALIQLAAGHTNVLIFCLQCSQDQFLLGYLNIVHRTQRR